MALLFVSREDDPDAWRAALRAFDPALDMRVWPDVGDSTEIDTALVWQPPPGVLAGLPNLRLIQSLGAGVDHIRSDPELPAGVPVARLVDAGLVAQMVEYVLLAVLSHHRRVDHFRALQARAEWRHSLPRPAGGCRVGLLGMGVIGQAAAQALIARGFPVAGWSRTAKSLGGVESFTGQDGFSQILAQSDVLVSVLPLTRDTEGLLDAGAFAQLPAGAYFVNAGRGRQVIESDLLAAIDSGHLAGAWLDVFETEPLPADHSFWHHPRITITPHNAGWVLPESGARFVIGNVRRVRAGTPPAHQVDLSRGY